MRGFVINTLRKKTFSTIAVRKDDEYRALCTVVLQLPLLLLANFNSSLTGFCFPKYDFWGGLEGPRKKFSTLAIASHIFRPPHKLCYNSTTARYRILSNIRGRLLPHFLFLLNFYSTELRCVVSSFYAQEEIPSRAFEDPFLLASSVFREKDTSSFKWVRLFNRRIRAVVTMRRGVN